MLRSTPLASALAALGGVTVCLATAMPPDSTMEVAQFFPQYNSQRVKIRYGPFTTDSMDVNDGMADFQSAGVTMPCSNCTITFIQAGFEYENGTVANANTDYWLHHTVFYNQNRPSTVCQIPGYPDSFFASGNERTPVNICANGTYEAGYYLAANDSIGMSTELMNMATTPQTAYVTVTWEYIAQPPSSFKNVKVLWLDIGGCDGGSEQPVKSTTQPFDYTSPEWVSDISGKVTFIGGHIHDGGTHLNVQRNGTDQCDCIATYGATPAYIGGGMEMSMNMSSATSSSMDMSSMTMSMPTMASSSATPTTSSSSMLMDNVHISNISSCENSKDTVEPGDVWTITAHYDPTQHDLMMKMNGTPEPIMGIALVYVADKDVVANSTTSSAPGGSSTASSIAGTNAQVSFLSMAVLLVFTWWLIGTF